MLTLKANNCDKLRDRGLHWLGKGCRALRFLDLSVCTQVRRVRVAPRVVPFHAHEPQAHRLCMLLPFWRFPSDALPPTLWRGWVGACAAVCVCGEGGGEGGGGRCGLWRFLTTLHTVLVGPVVLQLTNAGVLGLTLCKQLRVLNLALVAGVDDVGLAALARNCRLMKSMNLRGCVGLLVQATTRPLGAGGSEDHDAPVHPPHPPLRRASRTNMVSRWWHGRAGCRLSRVTDEGVKVVGEELASLQALNLAGCSLVTEVGLLYLARGCKDLQVCVPPCTPGAPPSAAQRPSAPRG